MSAIRGITRGRTRGPTRGITRSGAVDPFAGIDRDATSNIYVPANAAQWTQFRSAAGLSVANPSSLWLCQEASGNLADSIGATTLTANLTPAYQQAVAGWDRDGVACNADGTADRFSAAAGVGPSPATTSQTWLWICDFPATPGSSRVMGGINVGSTTNQCLWTHQNTGILQCRVAGVNTSGAEVHSSGVHVVVLKYDRTNSEAKVLTDLEKITGTYSASVTDGNKGIGSNASNTYKALYGAMWSGANAEISDANIKALLEAMGWTIPWS